MTSPDRETQRSRNESLDTESSATQSSEAGRLNRRRLLATLGVGIVGAYVAPTLFTLGKARADDRRRGSPGSGRSRPSYSRPSYSRPSYSRPSDARRLDDRRRFDDRRRLDDRRRFDDRRHDERVDIYDSIRYLLPYIQ